MLKAPALQLTSGAPRHPQAPRGRAVAIARRAATRGTRGFRSSPLRLDKVDTGQIMASSNEVTVTSSYCWDCTQICHNSGFGFVSIIALLARFSWYCLTKQHGFRSEASRSLLSMSHPVACTHLDLQNAQNDGPDTAWLILSVWGCWVIVLGTLEVQADFNCDVCAKAAKRPIRIHTTSLMEEYWNPQEKNHSNLASFSTLLGLLTVFPSHSPTA